MSYLNHYEMSDYRGRLNSSTFFPGFVGKIQSAYKDNPDKQSDTQKMKIKKIPISYRAGEQSSPLKLVSKFL